MFESFPTMKTQRLELRRITWDDAPELYRYYSDRDVTRYMDWFGPASVEDAETMIQHWDWMLDHNEGIAWGIAHEGALIGTIVFTPIRGSLDSVPLYPTMLGFELAKSCWNQGFMSEALRHVLNFAFLSVNTHRIQAEVIPENAASLAVLAKFGFRQEGLLRKYLYHEGTHAFQDVLLMALLKEDYLETRD